MIEQHTALLGQQELCIHRVIHKFRDFEILTDVRILRIDKLRQLVNKPGANTARIHKQQGFVRRAHAFLPRLISLTKQPYQEGMKHIQIGPRSGILDKLIFLASEIPIVFP